MSDPGITDSEQCAPGAPAADRRLRVLFINDTSRNGGPGRTMLYILKYLDSARIHRTVLVPREGIVSQSILDAGAADQLLFEPGLIESWYEPLSRPMERGDLDAPVLLKLLRLVGNFFRGAACYFRLLRRVRQEQSDLIFCNGTLAGFHGGGVAAAAGIPAIWHVFYPGVAPALRPLHRMLAADDNVRSIICVSQPTALQFQRCARKVRRVHLALDIEEFNRNAVKPLLRAEFGIPADTVVFGSCGRILPRKGYIEFIKAAKFVFDRLSAEQRARCLFVVVGDTPQDVTPDHLEECRALVQDLGLGGYAQFIGFRADVRPYLADFDVAIVPSIYEDPLPLVVMEAMAMSKPVVAFAMGGIGELFDDGVEGRLLSGSPADIPGLAEACLAYFSDAELRQRHGEAARARAERDYDARKHARKMQDEMFRVVNAAHKPAGRGPEPAGAS